MFVDTNILVNSRIDSAVHHQVARSMLERALWDSEPKYISRQIMREYLAVVTRPIWSGAVAFDDALRDIDEMTQLFQILEDGPDVTDILLDLCRHVPVAGRRIHDANIVATMLAHGERRLLTFNTSDFRGYGDRIELIES